MLKPKVLVATTSTWFPTARLAMALAKAGFTVETICPSRHPVRKTTATQKNYTYRGLDGINSFTAGITASRPDLLIPGDDLATRHVHEIYHRQKSTGETAQGVCKLIERSMGNPESFPIIRARTWTAEVAREEGVRVPKTQVIADLSQLRKWVERNGLPTVLKADGFSGGDGVRIAHTIEQAERAFCSLWSPPVGSRVARRTLIKQDVTLVWPWLLRRQPTVNAQGFIPGNEANSTVVCWKGEVLAALHFEVINKWEQTGPSTVVRLIEDDEMTVATQRVARRLGLSGLYGFDFIRETGTGFSYLIEVNPRTTQVGHLSLGPGRELPAALHSAVSGEPMQPAPSVTEKDTIALFPQEWVRDSESPFLRSAYHDIPWEEPEFVLACIRSRRRKITWRSPKEDVRAFRELVSATYQDSAEMRAAPVASQMPASLGTALERLLYRIDLEW